MIGQETLSQISPFTYAKLTLVQGEQGSGKSVVSVARAVDDAIKHIVSIRRVDDGKEF